MNSSFEQNAENTGGPAIGTAPSGVFPKNSGIISDLNLLK
jgi:hypothetical protein